MTEKTIVLPPANGANGNGALYQLTMMVPKRRYPSYLRERWWVVLVCVVVALAGVLAYETLKTPTYRSYAVLYATGEVQLGIANLFNEESQTYYGTQIELFKSDRLQGAAFERLGYTPKPGEKLPALDVARPQNTALLQIQATGRDPELTQKFLQALIDSYLDYKKETRRSTSEDIVASVGGEVADKERELRAEQDKFVEFSKSNNLAVLAEESKSAGLYLSDLNLQLAKLKLDSGLLAAGLAPAPGPAPLTASTNAGLTNALGVAMAETPAEEPVSAAQTPTASLLESARIELAKLLGQRQRAMEKFGEDSPVPRRMGDSITNQLQLVAILEQQDREQEQALLEQWRKRIAAYEAAIPLWEQKVLDLNERLAEGERLKNNVARDQTYYDHLLSTLQNVDLSRNVQPERVSILQAPSAAHPVDRHLAVRIAFSVAFGLALGLGLVFGWYLLDDRFVSVRDVKEQFGETVLGLIPEIKVPRQKPELALLRPNDSREVYVESFRHLRSSLLLSALGEKRPQTLLFTGTASAEGKTTVAVNLARMLASSGLRVMLVDTDLRNGRIGQLFGAQDEIGLLDFLRGEAEIKAIVHSTDVPTLEFVPVGSRLAESDGIFLRANLAGLLDQLKSERDFLILDGPPILAADDAGLLVPHADAVVMVVRPFFSGSRQARQALDMLYQRQAKQVVIVFNQARKDDLAGHYAERGKKQPGKNGALVKP